MSSRSQRRSQICAKKPFQVCPRQLRIRKRERHRQREKSEDDNGNNDYDGGGDGDDGDGDADADGDGDVDSPIRACSVGVLADLDRGCASVFRRKH